MDELDYRQAMAEALYKKPLSTNSPWAAAIGAINRAQAGGQMGALASEQQQRTTQDQADKTEVLAALLRGDKETALQLMKKNSRLGIQDTMLKGATEQMFAKKEADPTSYREWTLAGKPGTYDQWITKQKTQVQQFKLDNPQAATAKDTFSSLSADEVKSLGLPAGTVAQRSSSGKIDIVNKPTETSLGKQEGAKGLDDMVATLSSYYDDLEKGGGIVSTEADPLQNIGARIGSSGVGQFFGKTFGTENQSARNKISQARPLLLQAIKNATGMSAKQMDSNVELKLYLSAATDPELDVQANRQALAKIQEMFGIDLGAEAPATPAAPATGGFKVIRRRPQ